MKFTPKRVTPYLTAVASAHPGELSINPTDGPASGPAPLRIIGYSGGLALLSGIVIGSNGYTDRWYAITITFALIAALAAMFSGRFDTFRIVHIESAKQIANRWEAAWTAYERLTPGPGKDAVDRLLCEALATLANLAAELDAFDAEPAAMRGDAAAHRERARAIRDGFANVSTALTHVAATADRFLVDPATGRASVRYAMPTSAMNRVSADPATARQLFADTADLKLRAEALRAAGVEAHLAARY